MACESSSAGASLTKQGQSHTPAGRLRCALAWARVCSGWIHTGTPAPRWHPLGGRAETRYPQGRPRHVRAAGTGPGIRVLPDSSLLSLLVHLSSHASPLDGPDPFWVTSRWHSREPGGLGARILLGNLPASLVSRGRLHPGHVDPPGWFATTLPTFLLLSPGLGSPSRLPSTHSPAP